MAVSVGIEDLPDFVIEYILSVLSPYQDLKQCKVVSKKWFYHVQEVVRKLQRDFHNGISTMTIEWSHLEPESFPTISKRYSHSACCVGDSMYVFGGCTTANTTFNDLWKLNLSTRQWVRPLATGTYPPPKACSSLVCHEDNLVLFGGWTHVSPYPLHQAWHIFNHLHMYNITSNRWIQTQTITSCPGMAGHSATVHKGKMVVFGGLHCNNGSGPFSSSNEVWVLDLKSLQWHKQSTTTPCPLPRYGHSQVTIDEDHILILGGCGGPNMLFNDIWLLRMKNNSNEPWVWQEVEVNQKDHGAPQLSFHPACKIGNRVVMLSKASRLQNSPSRTMPQILRKPQRNLEINRNSKSKQDNAMPVEVCINGRKGVLKRQLHPSKIVSAKNSSSSDDDELNAGRGAIPKKALNNMNKSENINVSHKNINLNALKSAVDVDAGTASRSSESPPMFNRIRDENVNFLQRSPSEPCISSSSGAFSPSAVISIRPNSRRNRQRQLEVLERMEQRIRRLKTSGASNERQSTTQSSSAPFEKTTSPLFHSSSKNRMCLYVLDISKLVSEGSVTWLPQQNQSLCGPEEIILYSLVVGRAEIIMFGGIQKDLNANQEDVTVIPEIVSNSLYCISAKRVII